MRPALAFFASPEFDHSGRAAVGLLLLAAFVPVFVFRALTGSYFLLGACQLMVLCGMELIQWHFTKRCRPGVRFIFAGGTYLVSNLLFAVGLILCLAWNRP